MLFLDISESPSHTVSCVYVLNIFDCLQYYARIMQIFLNFVIELFAHFDSVLILFGIVAAARVVECNMNKYSRPQTFMKTKINKQTNEWLIL